MDRNDCAALDARDPLAATRDRFRLPADLIYLDGNSLGPLQPAVADRLRDVIVDEWGIGLIRSWNEADWVTLPRRVAEQLAPLIGADADEIAVTDSTSVDLFKVLTAARELRAGRHVLVTDRSNFPSDLYVAEGVAAQTGCELRVVERDAVAAALDGDVAVLALTHVDYRSGALHDAPGLTRAAHDAGALVVWDLSHSTGAVPVDLHAWGADFAVGCTYKYLNGGPGAPGYLYAAAEHADAVSPIRGWFGHARPFDFSPTHEPAPTADRFLGGTPPVLSLAALHTALDVWSEVEVAEATAKARLLAELFVELVDEHCDGVSLASPDDPAQRGAQVSLGHEHAHAVMQALIARGVIGDHRPPDLLRFGFAPLYLRYVDVFDAVEILRDVLDTRAWDVPEFHTRQTVT